MHQSLPPPSLFLSATSALAQVLRSHLLHPQIHPQLQRTLPTSPSPEAPDLHSFPCCSVNSFVQHSSFDAIELPQLPSNLPSSNCHRHLSGLTLRRNPLAATAAWPPRYQHWIRDLLLNLPSPQTNRGSALPSADPVAARERKQRAENSLQYPPPILKIIG